MIAPLNTVTKKSVISKPPLFVAGIEEQRFKIFAVDRNTKYSWAKAHMSRQETSFSVQEYGFELHGSLGRRLREL